jgi:DNA (cytosine-5)-methyltransferase 1
LGAYGGGTPLSRPRVRFRRGEHLALPGARVVSVTEPELPRMIRRSVMVEAGAPTAIDLFAGAGGLGLGLTQAGFHVIMAADNDAVACETYSHNLGTVTVHADLADPKPLLDVLSDARVGTVDLIAGGPPCQPFSRAGRSKIRSLETSGRDSDNRPYLWLAFLDFIRGLAPTMVMLENVPDLVLWENGETFRAICASLEEEGYTVRAQVLECWKLGVPQHRQRLFVVAARPPATFDWPEVSDELPTVDEAIGDLPRVGSGESRYWQELDRPPSTDLQRRLRDGQTSRVSDHITREVREDDREAFQLLRKGRRYAQLPSELRRYRSDIFDDKYNILRWDDLSRSITAHIAKDGYWYIHPDAERTLSIREAARLQTFPDWFRFAGYPSDRYRQIGNAVPAEVARRLGAGLMAGREGSGGRQKQPPFRASDFRHRLLAWHNGRSRPYPWRRTADPWLVLVAEILLRRTRADVVATVWPEFEKRFGTARAVARDPEGIRRLLTPLGLRWRVENLIEVAQMLTGELRGKVPRERAELMRLPGVGDYVADAVRAFAFGERAVLVDSNTARIASRVFGLPVKWSSLRNLSLRASVARLSGDHAPNQELNLALLDLGGTVCIPRRPLCGECPVRKLCATGSGVAAAKPLLEKS